MRWTCLLIENMKLARIMMKIDKVE